MKLSLPGEHAQATDETRAASEPIEAIATYFKTFDDLRVWISALPDQKVDYSASAAEPIFASLVFVDTPENRAFAEMMVASEVAAKIELILSAGTGTIVWRFPFETETKPVSVVDEWRIDGPFHHGVTDRQCTLLSGKYAITRAHCRLMRL